MVSRIVLLMAVFLSGCSSISTFDKYQNIFLKEAEIRHIAAHKVDIRFGHPGATPLSSHNLGMCVPRSSLTPAKIIIDEKQWNDLSEVDREILIAHEMGHCVLDLPHGEGIMQPSLFPSNLYSSNRSQLLDKLIK